MTYPGPQIPNLKDLYRKYLPEGGQLVEVGAYDGVSYSNTLQLLKQGWKGLYIEPVREYADLCRKNLDPYDVEVIRAGCGDYFGKAVMSVRDEYSTLMPDVDRFADGLSWVGSRQYDQEVEIKQLDAIIAAAGLTSVDLLVIDVEGYEKQVLDGFTLNGRKQPYMVIIELHELSDLWGNLPGYQEAIDAAYAKFLDYKVVYKDDINTVFVR